MSRQQHPTRIARYVCALVCLAALWGPSASAEAATDGGAKQVVLAQADAATPFAARSGLQIGLVASDTVGSENIASATSSNCTGCRANAVALQAVIVTSDPSMFVPKNVAVASNANCTACTSFAYAYQYVVQTDGPVRLSQSGQAQIAELRGDAKAVAASDLAPDAMTAELDQIATRFVTVVQTETLASGHAATGNAI